MNLELEVLVLDCLSSLRSRIDLPSSLIQNYNVSCFPQWTCLQRRMYQRGNLNQLYWMVNILKLNFFAWRNIFNWRHLWVRDLLHSLNHQGLSLHECSCCCQQVPMINFLCFTKVLVDMMVSSQESFIYDLHI